MRELLARFVIAKAEQGEKDHKRLIEAALLRLRLICNGGTRRDPRGGSPCVFNRHADAI